MGRPSARERQPFIASVAGSFERWVATMVRRATEEGDLRPGIDPRLVTRLLFGMSNSITEWYRPDGELNAGAIATAILRLAFDGLQ